MHTRQEYMKGDIGHNEFYAQFATLSTRRWVETTIGVERLKASTDQHLNDIPLSLWDEYFKSVAFRCEVLPLLKEAGDVCANSLGNAVCVAKAAARVLIGDRKAA